jgi:hypothetical protein
MHGLPAAMDRGGERPNTDQANPTRSSVEDWSVTRSMAATSARMRRTCSATRRPATVGRGPSARALQKPDAESFYRSATAREIEACEAPRAIASVKVPSSITVISALS